MVPSRLIQASEIGETGSYMRMAFPQGRTPDGEGLLEERLPRDTQRGDRTGVKRGKSSRNWQKRQKCVFLRRANRPDVVREREETAMTDPSVQIQAALTSVPSTPSWFGEVAVVAHAFNRFGLMKAIEERVRFVRARMGKYEMIDFVAMLIGYAVSGERTLRAFSQRVHPFAEAFMALFGRSDLPDPATLSRYLAALDQPCVEALRTLFLEDVLARSPFGTPPGGLWDRLGNQWMIIDVDGTRQAARQRALPATPELPPAHRRFDLVCAPGHLGRKRGEVVRTRTTVLQAHTHQWLLISGIRTIPTYHLICGFDARSFAVFKDSEGQFHISGHVRKSWQWLVPQRTPACANSDCDVCCLLRSSSFPGCHSSRRLVWECGSPG